MILRAFLMSSPVATPPLWAAALMLAACIAPSAMSTRPSSKAQGSSCTATSDPRPPGENPFRGACWAIDPESNARRLADAWKTTQPKDAALMEKIAQNPTAAWMGNWNPDIERDVLGYVKARTRAGGLPVMIFYNLPYRDCGQHSAGGSGTAESYRQWIRSAAEGIGSRRAVVVLEPDALPMLKKCLSPEQQRERLELIKFAVTTLKSHPRAAVYLDAGHSAWMHAEEIAPILRSAGIEQADGFALNVSNYQANDRVIAFGHEVSRLVGGKHFVVDTGRNGNGAPEARSADDESAWCNPRGRALGVPPTTDTGDPLIDAFYWFKRPGESDGQCNKGPAAGTWWTEQALELARNAKW
jgi:endoglucanase